MYIKHLPCGRDFIKRNDRKMGVGSISNVKLVMRKCDTAFLLELAPSLSLKFHYSFSVKLCPLPAILGNAYVFCEPDQHFPLLPFYQPLASFEKLYVIQHQVVLTIQARGEMDRSFPWPRPGGHIPLMQGGQWLWDFITGCSETELSVCWITGWEDVILRIAGIQVTSTWKK